MRAYNPSEVLQPQPGFIYEPRALWSRAHREESDGVVLSESDFDQRRFYNSEQRPIIVTHMVVMSRPLEYANGYYVELPNAGYGYGSPPAQTARIRVSKIGSRPFSMNFTPSSLAALGSTQSGPRSTDLRNAPSTQARRAFNDGFGVGRWDFAFPVGVPDRGAIQFDLSGCSIMADGIPGGGFQQFLLAGATTFSEVADRAQIVPGNARANQYSMLALSKRDLAMFATNDAANAVETNASAWEGIPAAAVFSQSAPSTWDNGFGMTSADFVKAQVAGDGPSYISGFTHAFRKVGASSPFTQSSTTPPMMRCFGNPIENIYCRARTRSGGTGAWWWAEGAPLAIVCPTQTSVPVYRFPQPFVLGPGDGLEVHAGIGELYPDGSAFADGYRSHGVWLSMCGYSAIEG